ncbi:hypothetical protein ABZX75_09660 [Streptomyces sp. NPDC003038]|uniref:hypothetical protein n=1 Tax=unclassified Streptomyces TaxID=2593676 RepID=UPI0033B0EEE1
MGSAMMAGRRAWLASGLAVPLALALMGMSAPATAAAPGADTVVAAPATGSDCVTSRAVDKKSMKATPKSMKATPKTMKSAPAAACLGGRGSKGSKGARGPAGPPGPCVDIDTAPAPGPAALLAEYSAALRKGRTYVGVRTTPTGGYRWVDLTRYGTPGYPKYGCGVSIKVTDRVYIKVLTPAGEIYENSCTLTLSCTLGWAAVVKP